MPRLLDKIDDPTDLKGLTQPELKQLASEIRRELVAIVYGNGGHLASNFRVKSIGLPDEFVEQGTQVILRSKYGLDAKGIAQQVLSLFPENEMPSYFAHSKISL